MRTSKKSLSLAAPLLTILSLSQAGWSAPDASEIATPPPEQPASEAPTLAPSDAAGQEEAPQEPEPPQVETASVKQNDVGATEAADNDPREEVAPKRSPEAKAETPESKEEDPYRGPGTLLSASGEKMAVGGYGGVTILATGIEGQAAMLIGAEGGLLLDHRLVIGLGGYGLSSMVDADAFENGDRSLLMFGYGGPIMRYQFVGNGPLVLSVGALLGGGGIGFLREVSDQDWEVEEDTTSGQVFFVIEPSVQAHVQLTRWMRLGANLNYRAVQGANARGVDDRGLSSFSGGGHLQFGWF